MWCYRRTRKSNQSRVLLRCYWNMLSWSSGLSLLLLGDGFLLHNTSMQKGKGWGGKTVHRHESQLHLMIAKGWSTCKLYRGSIVTPSTRRDHLSHQSKPALLPEHRRWIPTHHPCGYLCLTAMKGNVKPGNCAAFFYKQNMNIFTNPEKRLPALLHSFG